MCFAARIRMGRRWDAKWRTLPEGASTLLQVQSHPRRHTERDEMTQSCRYVPRGTRILGYSHSSREKVELCRGRKNQSQIRCRNTAVHEGVENVSRQDPWSCHSDAEMIQMWASHIRVMRERAALSVCCWIPCCRGRRQPRAHRARGQGSAWRH